MALFHYILIDGLRYKYTVYIKHQSAKVEQSNYDLFGNDYYLRKGRINSRVVVLNCITLYKPNEHTVYTYSHTAYAYIHTNSIFLHTVVHVCHHTYIILLRSPLQLKNHVVAETVPAAADQQ